MLSLTELGVLGFASYRGVQLIVWDTLLDRPRVWLRVQAAIRPANRVLWFLNAIVGCIYCAGAYVSGTALLTYLLTTGQWGEANWLVHGIEWFAVMGGAVLLNRWDDTRPGHNPEGGH